MNDNLLDTLGDLLRPIPSPDVFPAILAALAAGKPQEVCGWCSVVITPGTLPVSHGMCLKCAAGFQAEVKAVACHHVWGRLEYGCTKHAHSTACQCTVCGVLDTCDEAEQRMDCRGCREASGEVKE